MENRISAARNHRRYAPRRKIVHLLLSCALLPCTAFGQADQSRPDKVADAISQVGSGAFPLSAVEQIAEANAVQAVPALEKQFVASKAADSKGKIASALVRLGDDNDTYWNYLVEQATEAINSDLPLPTAYDSKGAPVRGQTSAEFDAWVKAHGVSPESAAESALFTLPGKVEFLAEGNPSSEAGAPISQFSHRCDGSQGLGRHPGRGVDTSYH